ncbi:hypothetical protein O0544_01580 [Edwardsiella anguillarum]|nr:hypothetical protein [Edwardsiella anguillarum]
MYYTAGIDKAGSGYEGHYSHSDTQSEQIRAQGSSSNVSGNLTITATDKLTQQGRTTRPAASTGSRPPA